MSHLMPRNTFEKFFETSIFVTMNNLINKIHLVVNELKKKFLMFSLNGENKSIDNSMDLYYKTHGSRQRINSGI